MKNLLHKICPLNCPQALIRIVIFTVILFPTTLFSQDTNSSGSRNIKSYLADFEKNKLFVKNSLIEYSTTIIENQAITRSDASSIRIVDKLKKINTILRRFDKGFKKNTTLRDSFIKMNEKTIECITNGTLILNDYELQSSKNINEVQLNLTQREANLVSYFNELRRYETSKKDFEHLYNVNIKNFSGINLFEYNAYQNILFYKINVIDQKILVAITCIKKDEFIASIVALENIYQEIAKKTNYYKNDYKDVSLNQVNKVYAKYIYDQNEVIIPLFNDFIKEYESLQILKEVKTLETAFSTAQYNKAVKSYNFSKNKLFDYLKVVQVNKNKMYDNWFTINRAFLKNNIKLDDI